MSLSGTAATVQLCRVENHSKRERRISLDRTSLSGTATTVHLSRVENRSKRERQMSFDETSLLGTATTTQLSRVESHFQERPPGISRSDISQHRKGWKIHTTKCKPSTQSIIPFGSPGKEIFCGGFVFPSFMPMPSGPPPMMPIP